LWNELTTDVPLPEVNFRKSTIIGVFYGEKPDLCYGIHIDSVKQFVDKEENISTVVYVTKTISADDSVCPKRVTQSFHIVQIPFEASNVFFSEKIIAK